MHSRIVRRPIARSYEFMHYVFTMQEFIDVSWSTVLARIEKARPADSQRVIAQELGVDQSTLSRLATGQVRDPRASLAFRLLCMAGGRVELPSPPDDTAPAEGS